MRPLIFWARDHHGSLRFTERTATMVRGQFVQDGLVISFQFDLQTRRLTLGTDATARTIQLSDYGWEEA